MDDDTTGRWVYRGTWLGAGIVMATNAVNAWLAVGDPALGGHPLVGLGGAVTVDIALVVGLIGDRALASRDRASDWGRPLRLTAGVMSLVFAGIWGAVTRHYVVAVLTMFLPVLLWLLTEYGQDILRQFAQILKDSEPSPPPAPVPAPEPVSVARSFIVPQTWGQPVPLWASQGHTGNGHRNTGPEFSPPPSHPDVPAGTVPTGGPVPDSVPSPVVPQTEDEPRDGTPSVDEVRRWRTRRAQRGLPIGHKYLRQRWPALTERVARDLIAQLKTPVGANQ